MPESYQMEWIIPCVPPSTDQTVRAVTQFLWLWFCGVAICQSTKAPAWQGHVTEQREHLHSLAFNLQTFCRWGEGKNQLRTAAVSHSAENTAAYCAQRWSESHQLMSSWSFLPGKLNDAIGSLPPIEHLWISVYQHLRKRPRVITERLSTSCTIDISPLRGFSSSLPFMEINIHFSFYVLFMMYS